MIHYYFKYGTLHVMFFKKYLVSIALTSLRYLVIEKRKCPGKDEWDILFCYPRSLRKELEK